MNDPLETVLGRVPGWAEAGWNDVTPLEGGITNRNYVVTVGGERFVMRLAGKDTDLLGIDRSLERAANAQAAALGLAPEVVAFLEPEGCLVTRFVAGAPVEGIGRGEPLARVASLLRAFHGSDPIPGDFDAFRIPAAYRATAQSRGVKVPDAYEEAASRAELIQRAFAASPEPRVPCHNDLLHANFLAEPDGRLWLLDWEYAGMNDRFFDLGNFAVNNGLDADAEAEMILAYFGQVTPPRLARLRLMRVMSDFREAMWGVVQQGISTLDFDYVAYAEAHFERLLRAARAPGINTLLEEAACATAPR